MSGVIPRFQNGPITYNAGEFIRGGQLVEARASGKVGVAGAGSKVVLGIATRDARPFSATAPYSESLDGFPVVDVSGIGEFVAVGVGFYGVKYAANTTFGAAVKAAAAGTVAPWVTGTDAADLIVGYCAEPGGVNANAVGLTKLSR